MVSSCKSITLSPKQIYSVLDPLLDREALIWLAALIYLGLSDPTSSTHISLFPPDWILGIKSPGFNLGHSISFLLHGDVAASILAHYFGIPAVIILIWRMASLVGDRRRVKRLVKKGARNLGDDYAIDS
ncbi:MAG: DUF2752 domain-containing protein [Chloroflexi bacterium]|nr:DUF2752 domain-containing protein [Chloroflexota bacterium]